MARRALRIARVADLTQQVSCGHDVAALDFGEPAEMGVVMVLASWSVHPDDIAAEAVLAHRQHHSAGARSHIRAARGEDVDPLMAPAFGTSRAPGIRQGAPRDTL